MSNEKEVIIVSEEIAIRCGNEEEWEKVKSKIGTSRPRWGASVHGEPANCIGSNGYGWASQGYYNKEGFTIISAAEYLNEGGKDVSEFEGWSIPPNVSCEDAYQYIDKVNYPCESTKGFNFNKLCASGDCGSCIMNVNAKDSFRKYMQTKGRHIPLSKCFKTTKENNMNTNISNVFDKTKEALLVEKHLGNQIGTSFIDGLILADKKDDVLKEAKRLEKEEKDK